MGNAAVETLSELFLQLLEEGKMDLRIQLDKYMLLSVYQSHSSSHCPKLG